MNKFFLRAMLALLTLSLLLTACAQKPDDTLTDPNSTPPSAQPGNLYEDFFGGGTTASSLLIDYSTEAAEVSFRAPDVYVGLDADGAPLEWTITHFALLDMDGDGTSELILAIDRSETEEYVILTCSDGTLYANQLVYRGFLDPKADGSFGWSGGAMDNGYARARFEGGVLIYDIFASLLGGSDGSVAYTLNGEAVSEEAYSAFLAEQDAKASLMWIAFSTENIWTALDPAA